MLKELANIVSVSSNLHYDGSVVSFIDLGNTEPQYIELDRTSSYWFIDADNYLSSVINRGSTIEIKHDGNQTHISGIYTLSKEIDSTDLLEKDKCYKVSSSEVPGFIENIELLSNHALDIEFLKLTEKKIFTASTEQRNIFLEIRSAPFVNTFSVDHSMDLHNFNNVNIQGHWIYTTTGYRSKYGYILLNSEQTIFGCRSRGGNIILGNKTIHFNDSLFHIIEIKDREITVDHNDSILSDVQINRIISNGEIEILGFFSGRYIHKRLEEYDIKEEFVFKHQPDVIGTLYEAASKNTRMTGYLILHEGKIYRNNKIIGYTDIKNPTSIQGIHDLSTDEYIILISNETGTYKIDGTFVGNFKVVKPWRSLFQEGFIIEKGNTYRLYLLHRVDGHLELSHHIPIAGKTEDSIFDPAVNTEKNWTIPWNWVPPLRN